MGYFQITVNYISEEEVLVVSSVTTHFLQLKIIIYYPDNAALQAHS